MSCRALVRRVVNQVSQVRPLDLTCYLTQRQLIGLLQWLALADIENAWSKM